MYLKKIEKMRINGDKKEFYDKNLIKKKKCATLADAINR